MVERRISGVHARALDQLGACVRDICDPEHLAYEAARILGEALQVSRAGYGTIHVADETIHIERDWNRPGVHSLAGVLRFRDYGSYIEDLKAGRTVVIADAEIDPRTAPGAAALKAISAQAFVNMPVTEQGGFVALLYLNHATARSWTEFELALIREVAERTRVAVERRRAEAALRVREAGLRETEERYRLVAKATNDAIWDWRIVDGHVIWNEALKDLFGHDMMQTTAAWWIDHIHPDDRGRVNREIHAVIDSGGSAWSAEYQFRRADGSYASVFDRGHVLRDPQGAAVRMIGAMLDLSERVAAEQRVRESEARYRMLFEAIDSGFCVVELKFDSQGKAIDYRLAEINPAFERQTGLFGAAGKWVSEVAPGLEPHWFEIYGRVARTGEAEQFENFAAPFKRWYDVYAFRTGEPDQHRVGILFSDITQRRAAEAQLRMLNETLEQQVAERTADRDRLWRNSQDLLLIAKFDSTIVAANPAWESILGWREDELTGTSCLEFVHPDDLASTQREASELAVEGRSTMRFENRYRAKSGAWVWLSWAVTSSAGHFHAVARDITAEKARDAELARAQEALRQSQKMEAVGQLTGGIAHDFNNLLAAIGGSLSLVERRIADGKPGAERYVAAGRDAVRRATSLTQRLLAFSRRQTLDPKALDINKLIAGMEDLVRRSVGPNIEVEVVGQAGLWTTKVDSSQLESALLNLCINGRDAMEPHGGRLTIESANKWLDDRAARERDLPPGQYVSLCVTDTGVGMSADTISRAFDPFYTTKPIGQGTGLGLSMVYGFTRQSGGQVRIYSELGKGTTVCMYLPRYGGTAEEATVPVDASAIHPGSGETVLVIDDEPTLRMLMVDVLQEAGYHVLQAATGPAGLNILHTQARIDLLVTDVGLPGGMNGRQVADAARVWRPELKVLFITGYAENAAVGNGHLEAGMAVVTKPFVITEFAAKVRDMIDR